MKIGVEPPTRTINKGWSGLLLEGMRRIDEATAGWSPEWEESSESAAKGSDDDLEARVAKALSNIRYVESTLILSSDGVVIAEDKTEDQESDQALGEMIKTRAEELAEILGSGSIDRVVLSGSKKRILLHSQGDNFYILTLAKKSSAETIFKSMGTVFKRYRSA